MSEIGQMAVDAVRSILRDSCGDAVLTASESGQFPGALWQLLEEAGITLALAPESCGGAALPIPEAGLLIRECACFAAPVPLAETMLATWLLGAADLPTPQGPLSVGFVADAGAATITQLAGEWRVAGSIPAIPWASDVQHVVLLFDTSEGAIAALLPKEAYISRPGINLASEPRQQIDVDRHLSSEMVRTLPRRYFALGFELGAALRSAQIAGALQRALELSVDYTLERKQFGRPIAKFQAIQHYLAILASQAAAAQGAAELALSAATKSGATVVIAAAKARASEAATQGAALAHQVHGAMGLTKEYQLHRYTQRLWSWRDEFGSEFYWWERLGRLMLEQGAERYWQTVCSVDEVTHFAAQPA